MASFLSGYQATRRQAEQPADLLGPLAEDLHLHQRIQALLGRSRYKPGWRFEAQPPATVWERGSLHIEFTAPDARQPWAPPVVVQVDVRYPPPDSPDAALVSWLWQVIVQAETHEAGEWFQVDGQRPHDPHREP